MLSVESFLRSEREPKPCNIQLLLLDHMFSPSKAVIIIAFVKKYHSWQEARPKLKLIRFE